MLFTLRDAVARSAGGRWKYFEREKGEKAYGSKTTPLWRMLQLLLLVLELCLLYSRDGLGSGLGV